MKKFRFFPWLSKSGKNLHHPKICKKYILNDLVTERKKSSLIKFANSIIIQNEHTFFKRSARAGKLAFQNICFKKLKLSTSSLGSSISSMSWKKMIQSKNIKFFQLNQDEVFSDGSSFEIQHSAHVRWALKKLRFLPKLSTVNINFKIIRAFPCFLSGLRRNHHLKNLYLCGEAGYDAAIRDQLIRDLDNIKSLKGIQLMNFGSICEFQKIYPIKLLSKLNQRKEFESLKFQLNGDLESSQIIISIINNSKFLRELELKIAYLANNIGDLCLPSSVQNLKISGTILTLTQVGVVYQHRAGKLNEVLSKSNFENLKNLSLINWPIRESVTKVFKKAIKLEKLELNVIPPEEFDHFCTAIKPLENIKKLKMYDLNKVKSKSLLKLFDSIQNYTSLQKLILKTPDILYNDQFFSKISESFIKHTSLHHIQFFGTYYGQKTTRAVSPLIHLPQSMKNLDFYKLRVASPKNIVRLNKGLEIKNEKLDIEIYDADKRDIFKIKKIKAFKAFDVEIGSDISLRIFIVSFMLFICLVYNLFIMFHV